MIKGRCAAASTLSTALVAGALGASPAMAFKDMDCDDFSSQKQAQKYFKKHGGPKKDPSNLDADNDGVACEDSF